MASAGEVSRDLGRAEGDVDRHWAAEYMRQHWQRQQQNARRQRLQQQQQQQAEPGGLPAMVLGWVRADLNLAAVTLEELGLENVLKVSGISTCCQQLHACIPKVCLHRKGSAYRRVCGG
jgi:hypothetical protein